jgi:hypothetical protein
MRKLLLSMLAVLTLVSCRENRPAEKPLRLNQIQVIGSHNSYKIRIEEALLDLIARQDSALAATLDYHHIPLEDQLALGLRNLEFDVYHDPLGGKYAQPLGLAQLQQEGIRPKPYDANEDMQKPGMKMFHVQDIDFRSHHLLFQDALKSIRVWSDKHPDHIPVFITINTKDTKIPLSEFTIPLPFNKTALDSLDMEIKEVLKDKLITPDMVRGNRASLKEAILKDGWPELDRVKGKFMIILDQGGQKITDYMEGHPALKGRVMFVVPQEGTPESVVMIRNNAKDDIEEIIRLVKKGFIVRTRADADTKEARNNDYSTFEAAKTSGAQIITTDYYNADPKLGTGYKVQFEDGNYERKHPFY